jgi:hypothetical protein
MPFNEVVDAADRLSPEEQEQLVQILQRRLSQAGRQRVVADVAASRQEFSAGRCTTATPDELMSEILK